MTKSTRKNIKSKPSDSQLPIIGIGASAGGLNALKKLFANVPEDSGLAYVIVIHLSPEHKSVLAEVLQPYIKMPVQQVTKSVPLKPNHVYTIPPNANLNTIDTHLRLSDLEEKRSERAPIDHFFRTLATTHRGYSAGIILTGTGSDGTLGLREIKLKGGLTIVQDPSEAEYDGMPQSAISNGHVDMVLPLNNITSHFLKYFSTKPIIESLDKEKPDEKEQHLIQKIFALVRAHTGRDFSRYKLSTILRRLQRRMQLFQIEKLNEYLDLLRKNPEEVQALLNDFLINVTNFFRDPDAFNHLEKHVIPALFKNKTKEEQIRIWSVGCATGEEAYSVAILLAETADKTGSSPSVQIFASDLHEISIKKAREGFFPDDIIVDVSEERLNRFFLKEDGGYRIKKEIRDQIVFTPHNLLGDHPFSRLDLIVCRNLLIYLKKEVQRDVFELFHYSLNPEGILMLGTSEHLESTELFSVLNKEYSFYKKRNINGPEPQLPVFPKVQNNTTHEKSNKAAPAMVSFGRLHQQILEKYAPPSLLLSPDYQVLHVSENAGRYLKVQGGELSRDVFKYLNSELQMELRSTIYAAKDNESTARSKPIYFKIDGENRKIHITVRLIRQPVNEYVILVMFEESDSVSLEEQPEDFATDTDKLHSKRIEELESELRETQQRLQGIIVEYETNREEMKASNEELQSTNEELRSTMEELETSKEELQSMNEELTTLNQENRNKVEELGQLSDDLQNLLSATDIATLFLDRKMRILRFTPKLGEIFNVRETDHGRLISDQTHKLGYDNLIDDAKKVLKDLQPIEKEIQDTKQNTYLVRILPYRSGKDKIEGIVITFIDITGRKQAEESLRISEEKYKTLIGVSAAIVWSTKRDGQVEEDSTSWRKYTGQTYDDWKGWGWLDAIHPDDKKSATIKWKNAVKQEKVFKTEFRVYHAQTKKYRWTSVHAAPYKSKEGEILGWIGMNFDIDDLTETEKTLRTSEERLQLIMESARDYAIFTFDKDRKIDDWNAGSARLLGYQKDEIIGEKIDRIYTPEDSETQPQKEAQKALTYGRAQSERWYVRKDGTRFWGNGMTMPLRDKNNNHFGFLKIMRDHTERMEMEESLREAKKASERAARAKDDFLAHMSHEIRTPLNAILGLGHLLLKKNPRQDQVENLKILKYSSESLHAIINDILDLSKLQAGKTPVHDEKFNLRDLLDNIYKLHRGLTIEKNIDFSLHIDEGVPEIIRTDKLKVMQSLNNLLSNAIKFTPEGRVDLSVILQNKNAEKSRLKFVVSDTGIGIPREKIDSIFETFSQADSSTIRQYEGTGLGLTITKMYVKMLGGLIKVESEEGKGSSFSIILPVKTDTATPVKYKKKKKSQKETENLLANVSLLLVEDAEFNRMIFEQIFNIWGIKYEEAVNGEQALEFAEKKVYDVILMDLRMPVMDGYEATRKIRKLNEYRNKPIVALTADVSDKVKKEVELGLFTDLLIKPVDPDKLKEKILSYLADDD